MSGSIDESDWHTKCEECDTTVIDGPLTNISLISHKTIPFKIEHQLKKCKQVQKTTLSNNGSQSNQDVVSKEGTSSVIDGPIKCGSKWDSPGSDSDERMITSRSEFVRQVNEGCDALDLNKISDKSESEFSRKHFNYPPKSTCSDNQLPSVIDNKLVMGPTKFEPNFTGDDGSLIFQSNKSRVSEYPAVYNVVSIKRVSSSTPQDVPVVTENDLNKIQRNSDRKSVVDPKDTNPSLNWMITGVQDFNIRYDFRCRSIQTDHLETSAVKDPTGRRVRRALSVTSNASSQPSAPLLGNLEVSFHYLIFLSILTCVSRFILDQCNMIYKHFYSLLYSIAICINSCNECHA